MANASTLTDVAARRALRNLLADRGMSAAEAQQASSGMPIVDVRRELAFHLREEDALKGGGATFTPAEWVAHYRSAPHNLSDAQIARLLERFGVQVPAANPVSEPAPSERAMGLSLGTRVGIGVVTVVAVLSMAYVIHRSLYAAPQTPSR